MHRGLTLDFNRLLEHLRYSSRTGAIFGIAEPCSLFAVRLILAGFVAISVLRLQQRCEWFQLQAAQSEKVISDQLHLGGLNFFPFLVQGFTFRPVPAEEPCWRATLLRPSGLENLSGECCYV